MPRRPVVILTSGQADLQNLQKLFQMMNTIVLDPGDPHNHGPVDGVGLLVNFSGILQVWG